MKEYKLVYLNKGIKFSREKDLAQAEEIINEYAQQGWELQQIVSRMTESVQWSVCSIENKSVHIKSDSNRIVIAVVFYLKVLYYFSFVS